MYSRLRTVNFLVINNDSFSPILGPVGVGLLWVYYRSIPSYSVTRPFPLIGIRDDKPSLFVVN